MPKLSLTHRYPWFLALIPLIFLLGVVGRPEGAARAIALLASELQGYVFAALLLGLVVGHLAERGGLGSVARGRLLMAMIGTAVFLAEVGVLWLAFLGISALGMHAIPAVHAAMLAAVGGLEYRVAIVLPPFLLALASLCGLLAIRLNAPPSRADGTLLGA